MWLRAGRLSRGLTPWLVRSSCLSGGMDFVADQLSDGRKIRTLTIVDLFSEFSGGQMDRNLVSGFLDAKLLNLVGRVGVEPTTKRLRVSCSTN